jgi:Zn-dependent protease
LFFENGSVLLFRWFGISVYLHWLWLFTAYYFVLTGQSVFSSRMWDLIELLALFGIVLLHEFGHALGCRQVGGKADRIILLPLGGVALIRPPNRPAAFLWCIAAGPLVNVVLIPLTLAIYLAVRTLGWEATHPDVFYLARSIVTINFWLLILNILPIYPMDGGQMLQALLWFVIGRARSVLVASIIGLIGSIGLLALFLSLSGFGLSALVCIYLVMQAWGGIGRARALAAIERLPHRQDAICPACAAAPLIGPLWSCDYCQQRFDLFAERGVCPNCASRHLSTQCIDCLAENPVADWLVLPVLPASEPSLLDSQGQNQAN